jgi:signal transduction histidine kinase
MFRSVKTRIMVLQLAMILFVTMPLGYLFYTLFVNAMDSMQRNHLAYVAETEARHIESIITERETLVRSIALDENVLRYSQAFNDKQLFEFFTNYKNDFHSLSFVNRKGLEELKIVQGRSQYWLEDMSTTRLFEDISWEPNKIFSSYSVNPNRDPSFVLNTGFYRQNFFGVFEGVVIAMTDLNELLKEFISYELGDSGYLALMDSSGRILLHPQADHIYRTPQGEEDMDSELILDAINMNKGHGRTRFFGVDSYIAYSPVGNHYWTLMAVLPYSEFIAEPSHYLHLFLFLLVFITFIGILVSLYLSMSITRPILNLTESSNSIAMGDLSERVFIERADEIGSLGASFNVMAHSLQISKNKLDSEARLRDELIAELENKNAELERYSYTVSHDLKSPLVTVKGFIGLLKNDIASNDTVRVEQDLDQISEAIDRMAEMLENLLALSRVGHLVNAPETVSLNELFEQTVKMLQYRMEQVHAEINIQPDMPFIQADRQRMLEVAQNLLENALKFRRSGVNPKIDISASVDHGKVRCCVADNGIGIARKYQNQIFGLFERLDLSYEGTGIGLALVKRIVEVHNGAISVTSDGEGTGARFCFTLPVLNQEIDNGRKQS